jgi:hypothetical protein
MAQVYNCTVCNVEFATKSERNNHFSGECKPFVSLTDLEGSIRRVERTDGKFACPLCPARYKYSNDIFAHWKKCKTRDGTESNPHCLIS